MASMATIGRQSDLVWMPASVDWWTDLAATPLAWWTDEKWTPHNELTADRGPFESHQPRLATGGPA
jgi:hypothetical protein